MPFGHTPTTDNLVHSHHDKFFSAIILIKNIRHISKLAALALHVAHANVAVGAAGRQHSEHELQLGLWFVALHQRF